MKNFFCGKPANFSNQFETLIKKVRKFPKFLRKTCQNPFCVSRWTFGRKRVFSKILWPLSLIWNFEQKTFGLQRKPFSKVVKTVFRVSGKLVWITAIFDRNNFLKLFRTLRTNKLCLQQKVEQVVKKSILRVQANVLEKTSIVEVNATLFFHSRTLIEVFRILIENTSDFSRNLRWTFVKTSF